VDLETTILFSPGRMTTTKLKPHNSFGKIAAAGNDGLIMSFTDNASAISASIDETKLILGRLHYEGNSGGSREGYDWSNHSDNRWTPSQRGRSAWFSDHIRSRRVYSAYEQFRTVCLTKHEAGGLEMMGHIHYIFVDTKLDDELTWVLFNPIPTHKRNTKTSSQESNQVQVKLKHVYVCPPFLNCSDAVYEYTLLHI
jgi:hypothetical protein